MNWSLKKKYMARIKSNVKNTQENETNYNIEWSGVDSILYLKITLCAGIMKVKIPCVQ